ncbi:MAG: hypothetical protein GF364_07185 [Candidatus Lokiarchaeota archaeon]|nr:hypothetical protein [Candidatus Lokiarchaeota archaeon]
MTNIGILGAVNTDKVIILRSFISIARRNEDIIKIIKTDFGEKRPYKETMTIHPNRVVFRDIKKKQNHGLYAPLGDSSRAVTSMGNIALSRISREIIAVFAADRPLESQFYFFKDLRFFPKTIYVCFTGCDRIDAASRETLIRDLKSDVAKFFEEININIGDYFTVPGENSTYPIFGGILYIAGVSNSINTYAGESEYIRSLRNIRFTTQAPFTKKVPKNRDIEQNEEKGTIDIKEKKKNNRMNEKKIKL